LQKLAGQSLDGIVLARAGLDRLGYTIAGGVLQCDAGAFHAVPLDILPAIGQGAIGIETRREDASAAFAAIDHGPTHTCIRVERELLRLLEGDCRLPVGARATLEGGLLTGDAIVFRDAGAAPAQAHATGPAADPERLAGRLFHQLCGVGAA
jgi:hydroxymethylbilane synthase